MHGIKAVGALSINLGWFGVPPSGGSNGSDRLKPGLPTVSRFKIPMRGTASKSAPADALHAAGNSTFQSFNALAR
jgi:hypothetical protein